MTVRLQNPEQHTIAGWAARATKLDAEVQRLQDELDKARAECDKFKQTAIMNHHTVVAQQGAYKLSLDRLYAQIRVLLDTAKKEGLL
jgi:hypothetical protein